MGLDHAGHLGGVAFGWFYIKERARRYYARLEGAKKRQ